MQKTNGTSLFELLVSLFILSLLFLGFDAAQISALRAMRSAYYFNVATEQMKGMVERLKVLDGISYEPQLAIWNEQNREVLPQGFGVISKENSHTKLSLMWGGMKECQKNKLGQRGCISISMVSP